MRDESRWVNEPRDVYTAAQHAAVVSLVHLGMFCPHRKPQHGEGCWVRVFASGELEIVNGALVVRKPAAVIAEALEATPRPALWRILADRGIEYELRDVP